MNDLDQIKQLIELERFNDAASLAIYLKKSKETRRLFQQSKVVNEEKFDAFENLLLADAAEDFDVYCRFLDYRQPLNRNFYLDRRKYFKEIADAITQMYFPKPGKVEMDVLRIKLRTRSGKSEEFNRLPFWVQGNRPYGETLCCVGGGMLRDNIHAKRIAFIDEYWDRHVMVFPDAKVYDTNKKMAAVWFSKREYADISTVTVGGSIEGHVQATNLMILDDLVSSNEINSVHRLEEIYSSDIQNAIMRRYISGKIILIGTPIPTLTGIQEPLDRFYDNRVNAGFNCQEFVIPSLDENMESNYVYRDFNQLENGVPKKVFTTEDFMRERRAAYETKEPLEIATFETIYQMKPMERGERLFSSLKRFTELPSGRFKYVNWLDPADSGADYAVMMYGRIYDSEPEAIYIVDIFRSKKPLVRETNGGYLDDLFEFIKKNEIYKVEYESNMGGTLLGETLVEIAKEHDYRLTFEDTKQSKNKVQRITDISPRTLKVIRLYDVPPNTMYFDSVVALQSWSEKSKHDDDIDCLTSIVERFGEPEVKPNRYVRLGSPIF